MYILNSKGPNDGQWPLNGKTQPWPGKQQVDAVLLVAHFGRDLDSVFTVMTRLVLQFKVGNCPGNPEFQLFTFSFISSFGVLFF